MKGGGEHLVLAIMWPQRETQSQMDGLWQAAVTSGATDGCSLRTCGWVYCYITDWFFSVTRVGLKVNVQSCTCSELTKLTVSQSIYAKRVINMVQQPKMALLMITLWLIRMENPETLYRWVVTAVVVPFKIWRQKQQLHFWECAKVKRFLSFVSGVGKNCFLKERKW